MSRPQARGFRILGFLALCILIESGIEWTGLRPASLTAAEDSISLTTGLGSPLVEALVVGAFAWVCLRVIEVLSGSLRTVAGEPKRGQPGHQLTSRQSGT